MTNSTATLVFLCLMGATILGCIAAVVLPIVGVVELVRGHTWIGTGCIAIGVVAGVAVARFLFL